LVHVNVNRDADLDCALYHKYRRENLRKQINEAGASLEKALPSLNAEITGSKETEDKGGRGNSFKPVLPS
jgi:hypothetical protein